MSSLNDLTRAVADAPHLDEAVSRLVTGLAERIKATSNDQNIQKLSRELKAAAPAFAEALAGNTTARRTTPETTTPETTAA